MTITGEQINAKASLSFGSTPGKEQILLDFTEATIANGGPTATKRIKIPMDMATSATNLPFNIGSYMAAPTYIGVIDRSGTGFAVGTGTTNKMPVAPYGMIVWKHNGSAPTLEIDNGSTTTGGSVEIFAIGS